MMLDIIYDCRMMRVCSSGVKRFIIAAELGDVPA